MFLERYRTALRRVKVSKDALAKREHPPNGGNNPQNRFALLEDDDPPMDPFEAFISEEVRAKCHILLHQPPPTRRKRGGRGIGKKSRTKSDESLEDIQTLQDLAVEVTPVTPPSSSPSSPSPRSTSTISLSAPSSPVVAPHMPQLGSANISIPVSPGTTTQIHGSLGSELVASPPMSSEKDFNHLLQLSVYIHVIRSSFAEV